MSKKRAFRQAQRQEREEKRNPANTKVNKELVQHHVHPKTEGQAKYIDTIEQHVVTLAIGPAGTGKTYLAVAMAVQKLVSGQFKKIVLTRPAVEAAGEKLGALPGDAMEKINPYMIPLYESLEKILGRVETHRLLEMEVVEVVPLAYMRGRTLDHAFIVMDEAQNATVDQVKMLMTRIGADAKLVVTGDLNQSDISCNNGNGKKRRSGLEDAVLRFAGSKEIATVRLRMCDIQRHPLIIRIIKAYETQLSPDLTIEDIYKQSEETQK
jgi:phosphate starvation-inducible PhoH-like protein